MKITIYTTNTCAYCAMVKKYLAQKAPDALFEIVNLDEQPERQQEAYKLSGALTVPVTVFWDIQNYPKAIVVGWDAAKLAAALR